MAGAKSRELAEACQANHRKCMAACPPVTAWVFKGVGEESVRVMPFYCGKRSAGICVVLGPKNPHRIPANTLAVFTSPQPRIGQPLLRLATKDDSDRLLAGCGKTPWVRRDFTGLHVWDNRSTPRRMLKKAVFSPAQPRRAKTRRSAGKAAAPRLTTRFTFDVSRFTAAWNAARTKLADFFSILLGGR